MMNFQSGDQQTTHCMVMFISSPLYGNFMTNKLPSTLYCDIKINLNEDAFCEVDYYDHLQLEAYFTLCHTVWLEFVSSPTYSHC